MPLRRSAIPLLQLAALRGRLMEILAAHQQPDQRRLGDQAFLCGIMSLMPAAPRTADRGNPQPDRGDTGPATGSDRTIRNAGRPPHPLIERLDAEDWDACDRLLADSPALSRETLTAALTEGTGLDSRRPRLAQGCR